MKKQPVYYHYTEQKLLNPQHPVTVAVIGCGGTGSQMLNNLARIHVALRALGHPGLHITAWDNDEVTEANLGRQLFSKAEVGMNKAVALITRINRFFGLAWEGNSDYFLPKNFTNVGGFNIIISCVDNVSTRLQIGQFLKTSTHHRPETTFYYWLDLGNTKNCGQVILGTLGEIQQPKKTKHTISKLSTITDLFPNLLDYETKDQGPSCSLAEALTKQDLFVNSLLAQYGANLIWKLFKDVRIQHHGVFVNLETLNTNPIKVKN